MKSAEIPPRYKVCFILWISWWVRLGERTLTYKVHQHMPLYHCPQVILQGELVKLYSPNTQPSWNIWHCLQRLIGIDNNYMILKVMLNLLTNNDQSVSKNFLSSDIESLHLGGHDLHNISNIAYPSIPEPEQPQLLRSLKTNTSTKVPKVLISSIMVSRIDTSLSLGMHPYTLKSTRRSFHSSVPSTCQIRASNVLSIGTWIIKVSISISSISEHP